MDAPHPLAALRWPHRTRRLLLRPAEAGDVEAVWAYRRLDGVGRWLAAHQGDLPAFEAWFGRPERLARTLVVEHEGRVVGDLVLRVEDGWAQGDMGSVAAGVQAELGWVLDPAYGGRGLGSEAVRALLDLCLLPAPTGLGLRRVTAGCFADNIASWRLMERVGMRREAHFVAESLHRDLGWLDSFAYALLADEWIAGRDATGVSDVDRPGATRSPAG